MKILSIIILICLALVALFFTWEYILGLVAIIMFVEYALASKPVRAPINTIGTFGLFSLYRGRSRSKREYESYSDRGDRGGNWEGGEGGE